MPNAQQELRARLLAAHGVDEAAALVTSEEEAAMRRATDQLLIKLADVAGAHKSADTIRYYAALLEAADFVFGLSVNQLDNAASGKASEPVTIGGSKEATAYSAPVADNSAYLKGVADQLRSVTADRDQLERDVASLRRTINSGLAALGITPDVSAVPGEDEFVNAVTNALDSAAASAAAPDPSKWVEISTIGRNGSPFVAKANVDAWIAANTVPKTDIGPEPGKPYIAKSAVPVPVSPDSYVLKTDIGPEPGKAYIRKSDIPTPAAQISPDAIRPIIERLKGAVTHRSGLRGLVSSDSVDVPKFEEAVNDLERFLPAAPTQRTPRPGPRP